jgi:protein TonB
LRVSISEDALMSSYIGTADRPDRAKAIAAVIAVHVALAAAILTGLNVRIASEAVERMTTINVREPLPPPLQPPARPASRPQKAKLEEGAAGKKAEPSPIVAPRPQIPVSSPIPAASIAGRGSATTAGTANYGTGPGAGGSGTGRGGGGAGDFSGFTPARQLTRIPDREYRRIAAESGVAAGSASLLFQVGPNGRVYNCRVTRSSGSATADILLCQLTAQYVRFSPARDPNGKPVWQDKSYSPGWHPDHW